jgi:metal-dependent HD superfamily phosphatase/phosphodiesterase
MKEKLKPEVYMTNDELEQAIFNLYESQYIKDVYETLIEIKKKDIKYYFEFVNAYNLYKDGDNSYGNICFMIVEAAKENLKY